MPYEPYKKTLLELKNNSLERKISSVEKEGKYIFLDEKKYLNLSSNDYLGIAEDKEILEKFFETAPYTYSLGSASSRLLTGNTSVYSELETLLVKLYNKEKALIFNSGYHANVGILSALLTKKDIVFSDKLNHASIIDGIRLSEASFQRYKHLDYVHLEELLEKHRDDYENAIIVTESLFSMDGDVADLNKLVELKEKYNAILIVDEAHAFGIYGENGLGVCETQGVVENEKVDLIVATFGKAIGSVGAFCVGGGVLIDYLINKSRSLIFSTALPEINIAFSHFVIKEILPLMKDRKENLFNVSKLLRENLISAGIQNFSARHSELVSESHRPCDPETSSGRRKVIAYEYQQNIGQQGDSYIIPVVLGSNENAVNMSNKLMKAGYYLLPIRHPTVPINTARIRISMRGDIDFEEMQGIVEILNT